MPTKFHPRGWNGGQMATKTIKPLWTERLSKEGFPIILGSAEKQNSWRGNSKARRHKFQPMNVAGLQQHSQFCFNSSATGLLQSYATFFIFNLLVCFRLLKYFVTFYRRIKLILSSPFSFSPSSVSLSYPEPSCSLRSSVIQATGSSP